MAQVYTASYGLSRPRKARYCSAVEQHEDGIAEWSGRIAAQVGKRVAYYRARTPGEGKGGRMSAQALSDRCAALGYPIDRSVIAKLEKGLRQSIAVADVLVLAKALGVPPLLLVFPIDGDNLVEALPGKEMVGWQAAKWFSGEGPFLRRDRRGEWAVDGPGELLSWRDNVLELRREQDALFDQWNSARNMLTQAIQSRESAEGTIEHGGPAVEANIKQLKRMAKVADQEVHAFRRSLKDVEDRLRLLRDHMRREGLDPGGLSENLKHVDEGPEVADPYGMSKW